jgi:hypothetical protein
MLGARPTCTSTHTSGKTDQKTTVTLRSMRSEAWVPSIRASAMAAEYIVHSC